MLFPFLSSEYLQKTLQPVFSHLLDAYDSQPADTAGQPQPSVLLAAFEQLSEVLARQEAGQSAQKHSTLDTQEITELGEYVLVLLSDLDTWIEKFKLTNHKEPLMELFVATAVWVSSKGGELLTLEQVTDALAYFANNTQETKRLMELHTAYDKVIASVAPAIKRDLEKINPGRPWRVLNLNRAIVATRCHDPERMKASFDSLIAEFPEDAPRFFQEGMEQMDALDYPDQIREFMEKYYSRYTVKPLIH